MRGRRLKHWTVWKRMGNTRGCGMLWSVPPYKPYLTVELWLVTHLSVPQALCCFLGPGTSPSRPPNKCTWHRGQGPKIRLRSHALETWETWHWTWSILRVKRALWLSVSVWTNGFAVYALFSATDRRWYRQCLRKTYLHRKKTLSTGTWEISGLLFILFYFWGEGYYYLRVSVQNVFLLLLLKAITKFSVISRNARPSTEKVDKISSSLPPCLVSFFPPSLPTSHPSSPFLHITDALCELPSFPKHPKQVSGCCVVCLLPYDL